MRQGQQNRRGRGRSRKSQNPLGRNLESNGPDVKIRGTASHIAEKYTTLARDALSSGDTVAGESYLQHAEHYNRIIMASQTQPSEGVNGSGAGRAGANGAGDPAGAEQPEVAVDGNKAGDDIDEGVARTIARSPRKSSKSGDDASAQVGKDDAGDEDTAGESPDEAVT